MFDPLFFLVMGLGGSVLSLLGSLLLSQVFTKRFALPLLSCSLLLGAVASGLFLLDPGAPALSFGSSALFFDSTFYLDRLAAIFYFLVSVVGALSVWYGQSYTHAHEREYRLRTLNALTAVFILGMQGTILSSGIVAFLFFWETMSMASFFLVFADRKLESVKAALLYFIMTHLGAGALMTGFLFLSQGSLLFSISDGTQLGVSLVALLLFVFGFGSKAGLWPFHVWLPEAHPSAPSHISALMSGVMLKVALYGFLRILALTQVIPVSVIVLVMVLGLISAVYGALYAVVERDVKRLLAYSSMENMGLIFTFVGVMMLADVFELPALKALAGSAVILHTIAHAFFKSGLFMGAGTLLSMTHTRSLEAMGGVAKRAPVFAGGMLVLILGAAALPPFSGFIGEWVFLRGLVETLSVAPPFVVSVLIVTLSTLAFVGGLAAFAMIKFFGIAFLGEPRTESATRLKEPMSGWLVPMMLSALVTMFLGLFLLDLHVVALLLGTLFLAVFLRRLFSKRGHERAYHTWDCGQPITSRMQYTATAFSAPPRFFFRQLLRTVKQVESVPVVSTNSWIAKKTLSLDIRRLWFDLLYVPIARVAIALSTFVRRLQNGVIQFYIALILLALVLTIIFLV